MRSFAAGHVDEGGMASVRQEREMKVLGLYLKALREMIRSTSREEGERTKSPRMLTVHFSYEQRRSWSFEVLETRTTGGPWNCITWR